MAFMHLDVAFMHMDWFMDWSIEGCSVHGLVPTIYYIHIGTYRYIPRFDGYLIRL
jgi:hypothetical protein